jgi:hypothetical protein
MPVLAPSLERGCVESGRVHAHRNNESRGCRFQTSLGSLGNEWGAGRRALISSRSIVVRELLCTACAAVHAGGHLLLSAPPHCGPVGWYVRKLGRQRAMVHVFGQIFRDTTP